MALESQITRILSAMDIPLQGYTVDPTRRMKYVMAALETDLPEHVAGSFAALDKSWSFRAMDAADFRLLTNATLDDGLRITDAAAGPAIVETLALSLAGNQAAVLAVSADYEAGATVSYDVCLDGSADSDSAGSFLHADEGLTLNFGTEYNVDVYPTDSLVLRITLETAGKAVRAVRLRLAFVGQGVLAANAESSRVIRSIAMFAAAYWFDDYAEILRQGRNDPRIVQSYEGRAAALRKRAAGYLTGAETGTQRSVTVVGGANADDGYANPNWEKFKSRVYRT